MKNRTWIIIFSLACVLCVCLWLYFSAFLSPSETVGIYQDGVLVRQIDLSSVKQPEEITLSGEYGDNVILVSHGYIKMKSADCPDKLCVKHGELKSSASPIVCLPNKIVIKFEDNSPSADAVTGR